MATSTARDIVTEAMRDAGVLALGQTLTPMDLQRGLLRLNWMLAQWAASKRWLMYHLVEASVLSTGAISYSVGPGQNINVVSRPSRLYKAFCRQLVSGGQNIDWPLRIIESREEYDDIALKTLVAVPYLIFYDSNWPNGTIYPWPAPLATQYEIHIAIMMPLSAITDIAAPLILPPEYYSAIHLNLVVRLASAYRRPVAPETTGLARDALNVIRTANFQFGNMKMPRSLISPGHRYNIISDE